MRQIEIAAAHRPPLVLRYGGERREPPRPGIRQQGEEAAEPEPRPLLTYLLVAINVAVFLLMMKVGHGRIQDVAEMFGAKVNADIRRGEWWRLLTPVFLHGSVLHLASNSLSLVLFGGGIERLYGVRKYLIIYFVAGVAGNLASFMHSPALSLGASGAIFGLVGAGLMFPIRFRSLLAPDAPGKILQQIVPIAAINLFIGATTPAIDNWAHMGGLVGGALAALFLIPDALTDRRPRRASDALLTVVCIGIVLITLLAGFKQWQWAMHNVPLETYEIGSQNDPWWELGVPTDWKPVGNTTWVSPSGVRLEVMDSTENPRLLSNVEATRQRIRPNIKIDGYPGWQIRVKDGAETSDLFVVPVYDRVVELIFQPSDYANRRYVDIVDEIIRNIHFDHAPQPTSGQPQPGSSSP